MIKAYRRSQVGAGMVLGISALIIILIWSRDSGQPVIVPIIATLLTVALGILVAKLVGNVLSNMQNTHNLGLLHMDLDPQAFLSAYGPVPGRLKPGSSSAIIASSYLADGYWADGQFQKAVDTVNSQPVSPEISLRGLRAANLSAYYLAMEDRDRAAAAIEDLRQVIDGCRLKKPDLARNLTSSLNLYENHLKLLEGRKADAEYLESAFAAAQYNIRRLELARVLAQAYRKAGDGENCQKQLTYLRKNGGKTFFKKWADQQ